MSANKLILHPARANAPAIDTEALRARLASLGLIGAAFQCRGETRYRSGDRFLQLITFLGCSPAIELDPPTDDAQREAACAAGRFCHVRLDTAPDAIRFRGGTQACPPRCPRCRKPESRWPALLQAWQTDPGQDGWRCTACGQQGYLYDLNFRRNAGFARSFIEIWGIYPSEAVPGETLLAALQPFGGCAWRYIYTSD